MRKNPRYAIKVLERDLAQHFDMRTLSAYMAAMEEEGRVLPLWTQILFAIGDERRLGRGVWSVAEARRVASLMQGMEWDGVNGVIPDDGFDRNVRPIMREIAKVTRARGLSAAIGQDRRPELVWIDMGLSLDSPTIVYDVANGDMTVAAPSTKVGNDYRVVSFDVRPFQDLRRNHDATSKSRTDSIWTKFVERPSEATLLEVESRRPSRPGSRWELWRDNKKVWSRAFAAINPDRRPTHSDVLLALNEAGAHELVPFDQLVEALQGPGGVDRAVYARGIDPWVWAMVGTHRDLDLLDEISDKAMSSLKEKPQGVAFRVSPRSTTKDLLGELRRAGFHHLAEELGRRPNGYAMRQLAYLNRDRLLGANITPSEPASNDEWRFRMNRPSARRR